MTTTDVLVIGASAAGLATAACLQKEGVEYLILEKYPQVATVWKNHYDRLHLHTNKRGSALPFTKFAPSLPQYPSKQDVINYLGNYAKEHHIQPLFNTEGISVKSEAGKWVTKTNNGTFQSAFVVIATGLNRVPKIPSFEGIDTFPGEIIHSSKYKNGTAFEGKNVLVVGFGNSACEQAICLHEHGAHPAMSVRSAVNVIPRDIFGFSTLEVSKLTSLLPPRIADKINAPLINLLIGDITKLGLKKSTFGPLEQIQKQKKIPLLDIGTIKLIRDGQIKVYGDIVRIEGNKIHFENNSQQHFDAIILATGYGHDLESFLQIDHNRLAEINNMVSEQSWFGADGLYFCGFYLSPRGMLKEIGIEAKKIAKDIAQKKGS